MLQNEYQVPWLMFHQFTTLQQYKLKWGHCFQYLRFGKGGSTGVMDGEVLPVDWGDFGSYGGVDSFGEVIQVSFCFCFFEWISLSIFDFYIAWFCPDGAFWATSQPTTHQWYLLSDPRVRGGLLGKDVPSSPLGRTCRHDDSFLLRQHGNQLSRSLLRGPVKVERRTRPQSVVARRMAHSSGAEPERQVHQGTGPRFVHW